MAKASVTPAGSLSHTAAHLRSGIAASLISKSNSIISTDTDIFADPRRAAPEIPPGRAGSHMELPGNLNSSVNGGK